MRILSIDTSCDETAAAVTEDLKVLSNVIWSQASLHAKFGGVMPSLAQRMHEERIDFVVDKAMLNAKCQMINLGAIAVTVGPGLAIALGVGIDRAKKLAIKYKKPLIAVNHVEAHMLSPLARPNNSQLSINNGFGHAHHCPEQSRMGNLQFPAFGLVLSGGNTLFVLIKEIGKYEILAQTEDDALGEALDKAARLLGFGYPGGAILEKIARSTCQTRSGQASFKLPMPLIDDKIKNRFSYSGLKTAFVRLVATVKDPSRQQIVNLAASFQEVAFDHIIRVLDFQMSQIQNSKFQIHDLLFGGGVANNIVIRKKLRALCKKHGLTLRLPYSKRLLSDNAAMIGVAAYLNPKYVEPTKIDRSANMKLGMI